MRHCLWAEFERIMPKDLAWDTDARVQFLLEELILQKCILNRKGLFLFVLFLMLSLNI